MKPQPNDPPYQDPHYESLMEKADYFQRVVRLEDIGFEDAPLGVIRAGDKFLDTKDQHRIKVDDVVRKFRRNKHGDERDGGKYVIVDTDSSELAEHREKGESFLWALDEFLDAIEDERLIEHRDNGWLPEDLRR